MDNILNYQFQTLGFVARSIFKATEDEIEDEEETQEDIDYAEDAERSKEEAKYL